MTLPTTPSALAFFRIFTTGAVFALILSGSSVRAEIVGNVNGFLFGTANPNYLWNIDGAGEAEARSNANESFQSLDIYFADEGNAFGIVALEGGVEPFLSLALGSEVDASRYFRSGYLGFEDPGNINGQGFSSGEPGYIGFRFTPLDITLYGWAEIIPITDFENAEPSIEVLRWAYEDSGAAITVGSIPEPSVTTLLLGVGTLTLLRRRKQS